MDACVNIEEAVCFVVNKDDEAAAAAGYPKPCISFTATRLTRMAIKSSCYTQSVFRTGVEQERCRGTAESCWVNNGSKSRKGVAVQKGVACCWRKKKQSLRL